MVTLNNGKIMKNQTKKEIVALAALIGAAGAATYMFLKTYKSIRDLENIDLDIGDDSVLSSLFKKD
jgi:hypothetical protein